MPAYIKKPSRRRDRHTKRPSNRQLRNRIYHSKEWRALREWYITRHPLCEECSRQGRTTPATSVHHLDSFTKYFSNGEITEKCLEVALDPENLVSVCDRCHKILHHQIPDISQFLD